MIRLVTYSHFINSAQFDKLDGIKVSSRADIDNRINDWKEDIGYNELSNSSKAFLDELSDYCMDVDWDYSDQMKKWFAADKKGNSIEELKPYCEEGQSVRRFLADKRDELCGPEGIDSFTGSVIDYEKDYSPWAVFKTKFYKNDVSEYISREGLSEQMGDCCHELDMIQKRREMKKWLRDKIASFEDAAESSGMVVQQTDLSLSSQEDGYIR